MRINVKRILRKQGGKKWTGFIWMRKENNGGLSWTR